MTSHIRDAVDGHWMRKEVGAGQDRTWMCDKDACVGGSSVVSRDRCAFGLWVTLGVCWVLLVFVGYFGYI